MLDYNQIMAKFEAIKNLDSKVFVEIPQEQIKESLQYKKWLLLDIETKWMTQFNNLNKFYNPYKEFNKDNGIGGYFGEIYVMCVKLCRYDGTEQTFIDGDYRSKRGLLMRDHYFREDGSVNVANVVNVHLIADNLVDFLNKEGIKYNRTNFERTV
jgi:hypothetical protein